MLAQNKKMKRTSGNYQTFIITIYKLRLIVLNAVQ